MILGFDANRPRAHAGRARKNEPPVSPDALRLARQIVRMKRTDPGAYAAIRIFLDRYAPAPPERKKGGAR